MNPYFVKLMAKRLREWSQEQLRSGGKNAELRDAVVELCDQLAETQERLERYEAHINDGLRHVRDE